MRIVQHLSACSLILMSSVAVAAGEDPPMIVLVEVSPSVVMALNDNGSNLSCVALEEGLVFIDTGLSTRVATRFRREMEARFERPALALVLTHAHLDHILGMAAFADLPTHAAAAGRPRWEKLVALKWDERTTKAYASIFPTLPDELPAAEIALPGNWFDDELVLGSGKDQLTIRRTGGHSADSSSVVVAAEKVVIAGDLVQARRRPYLGEPDTDLAAWIDTLRGWEALQPAAVCPGHGPVIDTAELATIRTWFEDTTASVKRLKADGASLEELVTLNELPAGYWPAETEVPRWWGFCLHRLWDAS